MEAQLKQRLVGAAVLVAAAVIVVPMLLDGGYRPSRAPLNDMAPMPPDEMTSNVPPLPEGMPQEIEHGLNAEPAELAPIATELAPPPDTTPPPAMPAATERQIPAPPRPATAAAPREKSPAPGPGATPDESPKGERWAVQLGSFSSRSNAELLVRRLSAQGVKAHMVQIRDAKGVSFRVRAGPVEDYAAAQDLRNKLAKSPDLRGILVRE